MHTVTKVLSITENCRASTPPQIGGLAPLPFNNIAYYHKIVLY